MARVHSDREYDGELRLLREKLLLMGAKVEELVTGSVRALVDRDDGLARRLMESDRQINRLEMEADELCLRILARRQPVASDLRFLTTALKLVKDLERIGDLGVNICERVTELDTEPALRSYQDIMRMAEVALAMVHDALDAFVADDAERAAQVLERDRKLDTLYNQIFRELLSRMMEDPRVIFRATRLQSIAKYLERVGDHATNLAEMVIFMVRGKDIRHGRSLGEDSTPLLRVGSVHFLCVRNSVRSQMAEAIARAVLPKDVEVRSAGSSPGDAVDPMTLKVLLEAGYPTDGLRPKGIDAVPVDDADMVILLCPEEIHVAQTRAQRLERWELNDPARPGLSGEARLAEFRRTRDELAKRIGDLSRRL